MKTMMFYFLNFIAFATAHFFLLDGRLANNNALPYTLGDSYYYSKLLCSTDFAMQSMPKVPFNTTITLRGSS